MAKSLVSETHVWVVEDNNHFRKSIALLINNADSMKCEHSFSSCEQAIKLMEAGSIPEIVLLDIGLPKMNGIEGITRFKSISPSTQIIILTMFDDEKKVFDAISSGAAGYLLKSSLPEHIIRGIQEVINGGSAISPTIAKKILEQFSQLKSSNSEYKLSDREKDILRLFIDGLQKQEIADKLFLSYHTINTHIRNIYSKLQVNTRGQLMAKVHKEKIV